MFSRLGPPSGGWGGFLVSPVGWGGEVAGLGVSWGHLHEDGRSTAQINRHSCMVLGVSGIKPARSCCAEALGGGSCGDPRHLSARTSTPRSLPPSSHGVLPSVRACVSCLLLRSPVILGQGPSYYDLILTNYSSKGLFPNGATLGVPRPGHEPDFLMEMQFDVQRG